MELGGAPSRPHRPSGQWSSIARARVVPSLTSLGTAGPAKYGDEDMATGERSGQPPYVNGTVKLHHGKIHLIVILLMICILLFRIQITNTPSRAVIFASRTVLTSVGYRLQALIAKREYRHRSNSLLITMRNARFLEAHQEFSA